MALMWKELVVRAGSKLSYVGPTGSSRTTEFSVSPLRLSKSSETIRQVAGRRSSPTTVSSLYFRSCSCSRPSSATPCMTTGSCRTDLVDSALGNFPIIGPQLQSHTHALTGSVSAVVIGSLLLLYGAVGLGLATQSAMNVVWNIPYVRWPSIYLRYLRALGVLVLLALSAIGSTVLTGFATLVSHGWIATGLLVVGSLALNFCLILLAFNLMTADALNWREISFGAALAAVFWQTLQLIGSWYIGRELQHATNTYGFFAIVIVLLTWIYLGAQLFLLAAEINVVKRYRLWPRSMTQPPLTAADRAGL